VTRYWIGALGAVLVLGAALRFYHLGHESLWTDEILSVELARRPWPALLPATQEDGHPPLYLTVLRLWIGAFGDGETGVRSLSAVIGVATLAAFFALAARLMTMRGALLATLLLACSPYHIYYSQEARNYALLLLLTIVSYVALLAWDARPRPGRAIAYVAATVLLLYTHVFGFFVWAAQILWIAARARARGDWRVRLLPSVAIVRPRHGRRCSSERTYARPLSLTADGRQPALRLPVMGSPDRAHPSAGGRWRSITRWHARGRAEGAAGTAGADRPPALWAALPQLVPFASPSSQSPSTSRAPRS
jgi:uncharacterized membrane protein